MVYLPLSRLVPLFIQQRDNINLAVRNTSSQKIYLLFRVALRVEVPDKSDVSDGEDRMHPARGTAFHRPSAEARDGEDRQRRHFSQKETRRGTEGRCETTPPGGGAIFAPLKLSDKVSAHQSPFLR